METAELGLRKRPEVSRFRMLGEENQNEDRGGENGDKYKNSLKAAK